MRGSDIIVEMLVAYGVDLASEYKGVITELDHHMLYKTITKWSTFMVLARALAA